MTYVDTDVWSCPHPGCPVTVRGNSRARRTTQRACANRHGFPLGEDDALAAADVAPSLAALAERRDWDIPPPPPRPRRGPRKRT